jgi:hypothetical protein
LKVNMTRRTKISYAVVVGVISLLFSSCQYSLALWVIPGSTANNLVFGFSESRSSDEKVQPSSIRIFPCASIKRQPEGGYYPGEDAAVWSASTLSAALPAPTNRITYGQAPGLENRRGPQPLAAPACYVVIAYARDSRDITSVATVGFTIEGDGKVQEMSEGEYNKIFDQ